MVNVRLIQSESAIKIARALCFYNAEHSGNYWNRRNNGLADLTFAGSVTKKHRKRIRKKRLLPATQIAALKIMRIDIGYEARIFTQKNHCCALLEINSLPTSTFCRHRRLAIDTYRLAPCSRGTAGKKSDHGHSRYSAQDRSASSCLQLNIQGWQLPIMPHAIPVCRDSFHHNHLHEQASYSAGTTTPAIYKTKTRMI